ncbi:MAG TPA: 23S rRNA (adenine(2503)-C(2))-methyltransferase RlmN [Williamwhitmania sp.]|nr:23S rRNA (adenine(2503)-C(2))-methyltransferase RlmN [Williamwhitmania sp.]
MEGKVKQKEWLYGKTLGEIEQIVKEMELPKFTAKQITQWLYQKEVSSLDQMTNLSLKIREKLAEHFQVGAIDNTNVQASIDGTKKYLFPTLTGKFIEAAYIPDRERATLCVSSQAGCKMGCLFCMTGKQGFQSQLTAGEILNQIKSLPERQSLTNVVYMGMGEPLDNLQAVLPSLEILTSDWGYGWSPKRITVSTIGIIPAMVEFLEKSNAHLAISLHTPFDEERRKLMPIQNVYPIQEVIAQLKKFNMGKQRRISFEYIMFKGLNDTAAHVKELARLLNGIRCRINLIRFHPIPNTPLEGSSDTTLMWFQEQLNKKDITTTIRASRGQDIYAACGLLSTKAAVKGKEEEV